MVVGKKIRDHIFDIVNLTLLAVLFLVILYPLIYVVSASVSDPNLVNTGQMILFPKGFTIDGYKRVFQDPDIISGYLNTIMYTVIGTIINLILTLTSAYALSKQRLMGRNVIMFLIAFTMYFSGGMIPSYLLIKNLKMLNSIWAVVIPGAVSAYNLIIARTFFASSLPASVEEAAMIDGCSTTRMFLTIVLPLSKALISVMALFYGVSHWNSYFNAMIYLTDRDKFPLQLILREILIQNQQKADMLATGVQGADELMYLQMKLASLIKYAVIIVSSLPAIIVYPFIQKHFAQGMMIGSIKG